MAIYHHLHMSEYEQNIRLVLGNTLARIKNRSDNDSGQKKSTNTAVEKIDFLFNYNSVTQL